MEDNNPITQYLNHLRPSGRFTQRQCINIAAKLLGVPVKYDENGQEITYQSFKWSDVRHQDVVTLRDKWAESHKPASVNAVLSAVRGVVKTAYKMGLISDAVYLEVDHFKGMKIDTPKAGKRLSMYELESVFHVCEIDLTPAGIRDNALIELTYMTGMRRAEIVAIDLKDYNEITRELLIHGKGGKDRINVIPIDVARCLAQWLKLRGHDSGPFFYPINRGGHILIQRMTTQTIWNIMEKRGTQAGIDHFSPHDLRRTRISDLYDWKEPIAKDMGHASTLATDSYYRSK